MSLDQRNDDQPIRSGELPVAAKPVEDLREPTEDGEFEETPFSKWILPLSLFIATIFTTLWAGAYQAYSGPIRGPVNLLLEQHQFVGVAQVQGHRCGKEFDRVIRLQVSGLI